MLFIAFRASLNTTRFRLKEKKKKKEKGPRKPCRATTTEGQSSSNRNFCIISDATFVQQNPSKFIFTVYRDFIVVR